MGRPMAHLAPLLVLLAVLHGCSGASELRGHDKHGAASSGANLGGQAAAELPQGADWAEAERLMAASHALEPQYPPEAFSLEEMEEVFRLEAARDQLAGGTSPKASGADALSNAAHAPVLDAIATY